jgi:hypothetical protein
MDLVAGSGSAGGDRRAGDLAHFAARCEAVYPKIIVPAAPAGGVIFL